MISRLKSYLGHLLLLMSAVPFFIVSCQQDATENRVIMSSPEVGPEAGAQFISIESSVDWTVQIGEDAAGWCTVTPSSGAGSRNNIILSYQENTGDDERRAVIIVSFGRGNAVMTELRQRGASDPDPDPEDPGNPGDKPDGLVSDPVYEWMELPAVKEEAGYAYVFHRSTIGGEEVRNYSMYYDAENRIALWVAYPICKMYVGSGRTDAWNYDPKIPAEYQPQLFKGWPEKGYDRGHQLPSGSRNSSEDLNRQTFYFTNMTAQVSSFNQGLWAKVEEKVRGYSSSCDTLYVVTGPILTTQEEPEMRYTADNAGAKVAVPKGYFKVLLKRNIKDGTYYSIAYLYDNVKYDRSSPAREDLRKVSEIEDITGITFFQNLPDNIENDVKNQLDPVRWGF